MCQNEISNLVYHPRGAGCQACKSAPETTSRGPKHHHKKVTTLCATGKHTRHCRMLSWLCTPCSLYVNTCASESALSCLHSCIPPRGCGACGVQITPETISKKPKHHHKASKFLPTTAHTLPQTNIILPPEDTHICLTERSILPALPSPSPV